MTEQFTPPPAPSWDELCNKNFRLEARVAELEALVAAMKKTMAAIEDRADKADDRVAELEALNYKHIAELVAQADARLELERLKNRIDFRLNECLVEMKEGYDDSITGFNEAWDIVRKAFDESRAVLAKGRKQG